MAANPSRQMKSRREDRTRTYALPFVWPMGFYDSKIVSTLYLSIESIGISISAGHKHKYGILNFQYCKSLSVRLLGVDKVSRW